MQLVYPIPARLSSVLGNFSYNSPTIDEEERFEIARQMAKFLFDNAVIIPTASVFQVWPVGPNIDEWELVCCVTRVPSNVEYIPHRQ